MLDEYGYTEWCPGCDHKRSGLQRGQRQHNDVCRQRIEEAVLESYDRKRFTKHAPPLPVEAVQVLERIVTQTHAHFNRRIVAEFALFCFGARLRQKKNILVQF